jgi:hypothetical protein
MRILLVTLGYIHKKNLHGFRAMCAHMGASLTETNSGWDEEWDLVWIPIGPVPPTAFPKAKRLIFGPHNFIFPEPPWTQVKIEDTRVSYNCLSEWNKKVYQTLGGVSDFELVCLPYPVDTTEFTPKGIEAKTHDCFLYTKLRSTDDILYAMKTLDQLGLSYKVIRYGSYTEPEYKDTLDTCRFGVWVGRHESQGFALQEALSCDIPLVVWDVDSMGEEWDAGAAVYSGDKGALKATAAPYWDARCGVIVQRGSLKEGVRFMRKNWPVYRPREFVMENLSVAACAERWHKELPR